MDNGHFLECPGPEIQTPHILNQVGELFKNIVFLIPRKDIRAFLFDNLASSCFFAARTIPIRKEQL